MNGKDQTKPAELSPAIEALVARGIAAHAAKDTQGTTKAFVEALVAVEFPSTYPNVIYPLPSDLTPVQRALAERLAHTDLFLPWEWLPSGATARRWLGVDPPGALEALVDHEGARRPLWRVLCVTKASPSYVSTLPMPSALEVLAMFDTEVWAYRIDSDTRGAWDAAATLSSIGGREARDWALARLAAAEPKTLATFHPHGALGEQLAFFALVRAGHAIDPAWDLYLPISTEVPVAIAVECARALPLERLDAVTPALLEKAYGAHAIQLGLAILAEHDAPAIARFVWAKSERSFPHHRDQERKQLAALAETKPGIAEVVASFAKKAPKKRTLTVTTRLAPSSEAELSEIQAAQLLEAGKRWDRKVLPVTRRLSVDENDESALGAVLEHVSLSENGKPAFDAWLYAGDSGTFFTAGTTKVIAQRIQMGIEIEGKKDPALADALGRVRESKDAVRKAFTAKATTAKAEATTTTAKATKTKATKTKPPTKTK